MSYKEILSKIRETQALLDERKKTFSDAENSVEVLENRIAESTEFIDVSSFSEKLEEVKDAFSRNNYAEAFRISASCQTEINSSLESWQPNLKIKLPDDVLPGKWQKYTITVLNEGSAHASQINIKFLEGVKQQGTISIASLNSGQSSKIEVNLVSEFAGSVNFKAVLTSYRIYDKRQITNNLDEWIEVSEISSKVIISILSKIPPNRFITLSSKVPL